MRTKWACNLCGHRQVVTILDGHGTCKKCGNVRRIIVRTAAPPDIPSLTRRALNFGKASIKHAMDLGRKRSEAEIEQILTEHCQGCEWFTGSVCAHKDCGCTVKQEGKFFNKLAWRSESCPDGKW